MAQAKRRPHLYVSCTQETYDLVAGMADKIGVKPSVVAALILSSGAQMLSRTLWPEKFLSAEQIKAISAFSNQQAQMIMPGLDAQIRGLVEEMEKPKRSKSRKAKG